jgi:segregation and condensation protein B
MPMHNDQQDADTREAMSGSADADAAQGASTSDARESDAAVETGAAVGDQPAGNPADADAAATAPDVMTVAAVLDAATHAAAAPPINEQLVVIIEALIFASPEPITLKAILKLLDSEPKEQVQAAIAELRRRYEDRPGGLQLVEVASGYQIVTRPELHEWVRRMFHERTTQKLSVQALETLAVIAYKQPITAAEITEIRGVNTSGVIGTLLERGVVKISGRKQVVGRPFLYSTTREFLDRFGLRDLTDLPKVEDMADALGFEVPVGIATQAPMLPADEPAAAEDVAVIVGEEHESEGSETQGVQQERTERGTE